MVITAGVVGPGIFVALDIGERAAVEMETVGGALRGRSGSPIAKRRSSMGGLLFLQHLGRKATPRRWHMLFGTDDAAADPGSPRTARVRPVSVRVESPIS